RFHRPPQLLANVVVLLVSPLATVGIAFPAPKPYCNSGDALRQYACRLWAPDRPQRVNGRSAQSNRPTLGRPTAARVTAQCGHPAYARTEMPFGAVHSSWLWKN